MDNNWANCMCVTGHLHCENTWKIHFWIVCQICCIHPRIKCEGWLLFAQFLSFFLLFLHFVIFCRFDKCLPTFFSLSLFVFYTYCLLSDYISISIKFNAPKKKKKKFPRINKRTHTNYLKWERVECMTLLLLYIPPHQVKFIRLLDIFAHNCSSIWWISFSFILFEWCIMILLTRSAMCAPRVTSISFEWHF